MISYGFIIISNLISIMIIITIIILLEVWPKFSNVPFFPDKLFFLNFRVPPNFPHVPFFLVIDDFLGFPGTLEVLKCLVF